jgi:uncharacterized protein with beta-barrel porin domain
MYRSPMPPIRRLYRVAIMSSVASLAFVSSGALADCTASGLTVTCTGSSTGYSNLGTGIGLTADPTATITGPILLGDTATVTNGGSITSTSATNVQVGANGSIVNNGTITMTNSTSGSPAVVMGDNGTLTNNGSLSATAGTPVIQFGQNGTFINNSSATAAVIGNILFGPNVSGGTSTLQNFNTAFGITGNISSIGNTSIYNNGLYTGSFIQTPTGTAVSLINDSAGNFNGSITTGDTTSIVNNGTMSITAGSAIGTARLGVSSLTNNGTLSIGTTNVSEMVVSGAFVNSASGILNISLRSNGASAPVAGSSFSQIYATGPNGTATLGGTLNIVPNAGFYPTGSTYSVILADQSISGNFTTVNGNTLPFISFVPVGITTIGAQQAYEVMAVRSATYAQAIASVATPTQIAIAQALQPLVTTANGDPTSTAATLIGQVDLLTVPQTQTLLDQINPAPYLSYSQAMTDQMDLFNRTVTMRALDDKNPEMQGGLWGEVSDQFHIGKTPTGGSRESMFGATFGIDMSGGPFRAGLAAGYSSASLKDSLAMKGKNTAYIVGAYAAVDKGPITATVQGDFDIGSFSASRPYTLAYTTSTTAATTTTPATTTTTGTDTTVLANSNDHLMKFSGTLGVNLHAGRMKVTPFGGLDYAKGAINGFTESGADAADLTVNRINVSRTDVLAGINVTPSEGVFRPYLRAAYRSQLGSGQNPAVSAFFNGDPTTTFTVDGLSPDRHQVDVDAGLNLQYEDGAMFIGYQGTIRQDMSEHGIQAGLRFMF